MIPTVGRDTPPAEVGNRGEIQPDWHLVVDQIRRDDPRGMEELYRYLVRGVRFFVVRRLGSDEIDDRIHDIFIVVAAAIRSGEVRDPSKLVGFVGTVVRRTVAAIIRQNIVARGSHTDMHPIAFSLADWHPDPESQAQHSIRVEFARRLLQGLSRRDREVLHRFYVEDQSQDQICAEMRLTYNQFRLLKHRAKARLGDMGRRVAQRLGISEPPKKT